eukprot:TRINITY_DN61096_c0_g1_i1.p1 TRINITY_DN61096_c0_g1~~TRINITY_DN61096_c0_g1_i1.p1  ORF type:complete len:334 (+),score=100.56 TRINITY_DN61096_c0_g1_i1:74-1075(+)
MAAGAGGHGLRCADPADVERKVAALRKAAAERRLCVLIDFDRTITSCFMPGGEERVASAYEVLEQAAHFEQTYRDQVKALLGKYHPIEIDPSLTREQKIPIMVEWYSTANSLLLTQHITEDCPRRAAESCPRVCLREGAKELIFTCQNAGIPVVVLSAGMGNVIEVLLRRLLPFPVAPTTHLVSNWMVFEEGRLTGFTKPLMHMFNKSLAFAPSDVRDLVKACDCCLLVGDSPGDAQMADGHDWAEVLRVGLLNENVDAQLPEYLPVFDAVSTHDRPLPEFVLRSVRPPSPRRKEGSAIAAVAVAMPVAVAVAIALAVAVQPWCSSYWPLPAD